MADEVKQKVGQWSEKLKRKYVTKIQEKEETNGEKEVPRADAAQNG